MVPKVVGRVHHMKKWMDSGEVGEVFPTVKTHFALDPALQQQHSEDKRSKRQILRNTTSGALHCDSVWFE